MPPSMLGSWCDLRGTNTPKNTKRRSLISDWNWITCLLKTRLNKYSGLRGLLSGIFQHVLLCCCVSCSAFCVQITEELWVCVAWRKKKKTQIKLFVTVSSRRFCFSHLELLPQDTLLFLFKVWHCELLLLSRWQHAENKHPTGVRIALFFFFLFFPEDVDLFTLHLHFNWFRLTRPCLQHVWDHSLVRTCRSAFPIRSAVSTPCLYNTLCQSLIN